MGPHPQKGYEKPNPSSTWLRVEEGRWSAYLTMKLVAIWVAMTPIPVVALLAAAILVELTIASVPFAEVYAVGTVFAVIPLMVVTMIAIVVSRMIDADHHFLGGGRLGCCRSSECRGQEKKTEIFGCYVHVWSSVNREPRLES